jgi:hypothetical protein
MIEDISSVKISSEKKFSDRIDLFQIRNFFSEEISRLEISSGKKFLD